MAAPLVAMVLAWLGWHLGKQSVPLAVTHQYFGFFMALASWAGVMLCVREMFWPRKR